MARSTSVVVVQKKHYLLEVCEEVLQLSRYFNRRKFFRQLVEKIVSLNEVKKMKIVE